MQKILIIEDDKVIARTLKEHLCKWDYDADFVVDFKNITEQVVSFAPQLILLDILYLCRILTDFIGAAKYASFQMCL